MNSIEKSKKRSSCFWGSFWDDCNKGVLAVQSKNTHRCWDLALCLRTLHVWSGSSHCKLRLHFLFTAFTLSLMNDNIHSSLTVQQFALLITTYFGVYSWRGTSFLDMCLLKHQILNHTEYTPENSMVSTVTMVTLKALVFCSLCSLMAVSPSWMTCKTHKLNKSECFSRSARNRWCEPKLIFSSVHNMQSFTVSSSPAITPILRTQDTRGSHHTKA